MNKDKRNNIQLLGTLTNADESGIIANANQIYDANEDKSTQDVSKEHTERIKTLETKEDAMQTTLENITKTGEASAASNVTYNHSDSKLDATNVQQAVDEIASAVATETSRAQEAETTINSNIDKTLRDAKDYTNSKADTLQTNINTEVDARKAADSALSDRITAEQTRAANAENTLDGRVDTLEEAVGTGGSVDSRIASAVDEVRKRSNYNDGDNIIDFNTIHLITDNPEFAIAVVDINDKIFYGIKADGQPYWGVGVPKVVRDYVDKQINDILGTDNITETIGSLKEVEKFLSDFKNSDTLKALLDTKANKTDVDNTVANINADIADKYKKSNPNDEEGNVIDTNSIKSVINNPEYSIAWVDNTNKIIFAIQHDGNPYFGYGVPKDVDAAIASAVATETSRAQEAEANRYTKNETYTKEEVNNLISTKTVFDISAYHATGGTLATYDNLKDALGTNGENIPQSLRKGGMSVKFVQSSDNKYVQYRLMSKTFNTNVTQWQGVDDVPTVPTNVSAFTNDAGYLTQHQDISGKEDVTTIVAPVNTTDATLSITTLTTEVGKYYRLDVAVETLTVTLPAITDLTTVRTVVIYLTGGTTPSITISTADSKDVYFQDGFEIEANSTYEINCLFNGVAWIVAAVKINVE